MSNTRLTRVLAALVAASTLASCAHESVLDAQGDRERRGAAREKAADGGPRSQKAEKAQQGRAVEVQEVKSRQGKSGSDADSSGGADQGVAPTDGGTGTSNGPKQQDQAPSRPAEACASDMARDMDSSGDAPAYADLQRGCVREQGSQISLEATTVAALPARMPDENTHLAVSFALERPAGETVYVTVQSTDDGWTTSLSDGDGSRSLPAPVIDGKRLRVSIPASTLDGAREVAWQVESSWLRATLVSTEYAFDDAPNGGMGSFDRG